MGFVVFLFIVAGIIVLVVLRNKRKKAQAIEDLKNSNVYALVLKIEEELKKKGYDLSNEPIITYYDSKAGGRYLIYNSSRWVGTMYYTEYQTEFSMDLGIRNLRMDNSSGRGRFYGIKGANISVVVTSGEASQDMPEYIKIAAEVINNSGYGPCTQIE